MPIVTNPTAGDVHVNRPLTTFSQKYLQASGAFIGLEAMPNQPVAKQSDLYYVFDRGDFFRDEAEERADGTESAGGAFNLSTDPYFARVYAYHKDVTDRQRANQDEPVQLDMSATQYVTHKLLIRREALFTSTFFGAGIWDTDQDVDWQIASAADPIVDVRAAISGVHSKTGFRPNRMLLGRTAWDTLMDNDALLSRITGGANNAMPAMVQRQLVAALFELQSIHVMDSVVNSALPDDVEATDFIGGDNALVYYAPDSVGLEEPTAGTQFSWTGFLGATSQGMRIKRFRMENLESDRVEGQMAFAYKVIASELGHLFTTVSPT